MEDANIDDPEVAKRILFDACRTGSLPTVKELVPIIGVNVHADNEWNGPTPLITAIQYKQDAVVDFLLSLPDIDVNLPEGAGPKRSPLHYALYNSTDPVKNHAVKALLKDPRVDLEQVDREGQTALFDLVLHYRDRAVRMLLTCPRTIQTNLDNDKGWTLDALLQYMDRWDIKNVIHSYRANPAAERQAQRTRLGLSIPSPMLFAGIVYVSDGFLTVSTEQQDSAARQFFEINSRLPMELQMIASNRAQNSTRDFISSRESERAFQDLMRNILKD